MVVKCLYQDVASIHSLFQNLHSLILGSSHPKIICTKVVLQNFTTFTRKHLCMSLFSEKVAGCMQILYFMISQKRKHKKLQLLVKRKHAYILKLKFYLKSRSTAYFLKTILNKALLISHSTVFLVDSLHSSKTDLTSCLMFLISCCKTYHK